MYLDTSIIVALLAKEAPSNDIKVLLRNLGTQQPVISDWNITEFAAAISFKLKLGTIRADERFEILNDFQSWCDSIFQTVPVTTDDFNRAATFANQADLRLRGGDALHLSIAAGRSLSILTLDKRMVAVANTLGIGIVSFD